MRIVLDGLIAEFGDLCLRDEPWQVCVTGGREWDDFPFVNRSLNLFEDKIGIINEIGHGDARGVDRMCRDWARSGGVLETAFAADWDRYGDAAGAIRNGEMLEQFKPEALLVFPGGTGTQDCTRKARKMGIPRIFFTVPEETPFADLLSWG